MYVKMKRLLTTLIFTMALQVYACLICLPLVKAPTIRVGVVWLLDTDHTKTRLAGNVRDRLC
jgi:hypothetical protein